MIRGLRWASAIFLGGAGISLILGGPEWLSWISFAKLPAHVGIQALISLAWLGLAFMLAPVPAKYRVAVLASVVPGAVIAALTLLQGCP
jgi:hypothetical protein